MITIHPKGITIAEGSDVKLTCEATGDGTLNYQWRRVSGSLQRNSGRQTLTIRNIVVDDSGQYYCEVDNGGEKVTSKRAEVAVRSQLLSKIITKFIITYHMYRGTLHH